MLTECQKTFCHECMFYQDGHFARMDILSGWTFCQDGRFVRKTFVRTALDVLSGPKYLDTIWTILLCYLGTTSKLYEQYSGITPGQVGHHLGVAWTLFDQNFGNTRGQLGHYLDNIWMILGQNFGNTLILIGWYLGSTWAPHGPRGSMSRPKESQEVKG